MENHLWFLNWLFNLDSHKLSSSKKLFILPEVTLHISDCFLSDSNEKSLLPLCLAPTLKTSLLLNTSFISSAFCSGWLYSFDRMFVFKAMILNVELFYSFYCKNKWKAVGMLQNTSINFIFISIWKLILQLKKKKNTKRVLPKYVFGCKSPHLTLLLQNTVI